MPILSLLPKQYRPLSLSSQVIRGQAAWGTAGGGGGSSLQLLCPLQLLLRLPGEAVSRGLGQAPWALQLPACTQPGPTAGTAGEARPGSSAAGTQECSSQRSTTPPHTQQASCGMGSASGSRSSGGSSMAVDVVLQLESCLWVHLRWVWSLMRPSQHTMSTSPLACRACMSISTGLCLWIFSGEACHLLHLNCASSQDN